jgi:hypothetical protein
VPHVPQLLRSYCVGEQRPLQLVVGEGQPHEPFTHPAPPVQATLHAPQLLGSFAVFTHAPPQLTSGAVHPAAHVPLLQT